MDYYIVVYVIKQYVWHREMVWHIIQKIDWLKICIVWSKFYNMHMQRMNIWPYTCIHTSHTLTRTKQNNDKISTTNAKSDFLWVVGLLLLPCSQFGLLCYANIFCLSVYKIRKFKVNEKRDMSCL